MERRKEDPQAKFLENFVRDMEVFFKRLADKALRMDLDELAGVYEKKIDALILQKERDGLLTYVGGEFTIAYVSETEFSLKLELYFQNERAEWIKLEPQSIMRNTKYLKEWAVAELREKKSVVYDIPHPNTKNGEDTPPGQDKER